MFIRSFPWQLPLWLLVMLVLVGCNQEPGTTPVTAPPTSEPDFDHAHGTTGPHGGALVEIGNGAYHAELVQDTENHRLTIYLLDASAQQAVSIRAPQMVLNVRHDGKGQQFALAAAPDQNDPQGQSSRFVTESEQLANLLQQEQGTAQLVVTIQNVQHRGEVALPAGQEHHTHSAQEGHDHQGPHDHGHGEHGHEHGEHGHDHGGHDQLEDDDLQGDDAGA